MTGGAIRELVNSNGAETIENEGILTHCSMQLLGLLWHPENLLDNRLQYCCITLKATLNIGHCCQ